MKTCKTCGVEKELDEFYDHPKTSGRKFHKCKSCVIAYQAVYDADPEYRKRAKARELWKLYKMTLEEFESLLEKQNNRCAICQVDLLLAGPVVDHDHLTGKVRGLLCATCNRGLGFFGDDPAILDIAVEYLRS